MCSTPPRQPILPIEDPDGCWSLVEDYQSFLRVPRKKPSSSFSHGRHLSEFVRVVCISDTHGKHRSIPIPKCDILIHAGDFSVTGEQHFIQDLNEYFKELKQNNIVKEIICIAGNHDMTFHPEKYSKVWKWFHPRKGPLDCKAARQTFQDCIYLEDQLHTYATPTMDEEWSHEEKKINIYGSPWTPTYGVNWAFNQDRNVIEEKWDLIPSDQKIDILITHGPPLGRGDCCKSKNRAGCLSLLRKVQNEVKPRIHVFGHIHEDGGCSYDGQTLYVNASSVNIGYQPKQPCFVIDLPFDESKPAQVVRSVSNLDGYEVIEWLKEKANDEKFKEFSDLIPYFEKKTPFLLTGDDILKCVKDCNMLLCHLDIHRERNVDDLKRNLTKMILCFRAESF